MTTEPQEQADRLAQLRARRSAPVDHRRAVIGKILATGLTSTTVFGITAALGWSATSAASNEETSANPTTEQLVLDLASGQLVRYVDGVPVSAQQVMNPALIAAPSPNPIPAPAATDTPLLPTLPANWNPAPTSAASTKQTAPGTVAPPISIAPDDQATTVIVETPVQPTPEVVTIPVAVPEPVIRERPSGGGSNGGGGGSSSSS